MPLYEYECDACGHRFEIIHQKFSDPPAASCPSCGGPVHKLQSAPAIQFKGTGFYITDYAKKEESTAAKEDAKESAKETQSSKDGDAPSSDKSEKAADTTKSPSSSDPASTSAPPKEAPRSGSGQAKETPSVKPPTETKSKTD